MNKNEPLIHISRRGNLTKAQSVGITALAILAALIICAVIIIGVTGENPLEVFMAVVKGSFGSSRKFWVFFQNTMLLLGIALAVTPAFKMRCWNLGAEGQVLMGSLCAAACMLLLGGKLPNGLLYVIMTVTAVLAGAIWAAIPAFFKTKWNTNETLFTLMMNYVAAQLVNYYVKVWENPKGSNTVGIINQKTNYGWLPQLVNKQLLSIVIVFLLMIFMYIYLRYTKHGYEIAVVGESERTARYIGIKVDRVIIRTMCLSGAICGLMGLLLVGSVNHTIFSTIAEGNGFTGVMISWMSKFNPFTMLASSGLLTFMKIGASDIATDFGLNRSFSDILIGVVIFFIIGSEFFANYTLKFRKSSSKKEVSGND